MILQKYESYKDSGVQWLGEIPEEWKIKRLKDVYLEIGSGGTPSSDNLTYYEGNIPWVRSGDLNNSIVEDVPYKITEEALKNSSAKIFPKGTFIIAMYGASVGKIGILGSDASTNQACCCIVTNPKKINLKFLHYYYNFYKPLLIKDAVGGGQPNISQGLLKRSWLILPEINMQEKIVIELDKKTSRIDTKIKVLQDKITSYEELKRTLVNETVCRGLNKSVDLKDSGIEWIGKIPKHWKIDRNKNMFYESKKLSKTGKEDLLSVSEYTGVTIKGKDEETGENDSRADSLEEYKICNKGDLVINIMLAWKTGLGVSTFFGIVSPAYGVYSPKNVIASEYYHYLFRTDMYTAEFRRNSTGIISSRLRLYSDKFFAIHSILPPKPEQIQIAKYLDEKTSKIDKIISKIDEQINTLTEFRKTLINDVVTGKVRVSA